MRAKGRLHNADNGVPGSATVGSNRPIFMGLLRSLDALEMDRKDVFSATNKRAGHVAVTDWKFEELRNLIFGWDF